MQEISIMRNRAEDAGQSEELGWADQLFARSDCADGGVW